MVLFAIGGVVALSAVLFIKNKIMDKNLKD